MPGLIRPPIFFLLVAASAAPVAASFLIPQWLSWWALLAGAAAYSVGFALDVRSTVSYGLETVRRCETSPLFSALCRRGFGTAVAAQIGFEISIAALVLPMLMFAAPDAGMAGAALVAFGGLHLAGWRLNVRGRTARP